MPKTAVGITRMEFVANMGNFQLNVKRSKKQYTEFQKSVKKDTGLISTNFKRLGAAIAAAVSARAFAGAIEGSLRTARELGAVSDRLQIATEEITALRLAGDRYQLSSQKIELGLQRQTRRISEAAKGYGEAKAAIKELGLDAVRLNQSNPAEQLEMIAAALDRLSSNQDRIRLGFKLFDSEGVDLIRLTSSAIDEARRDAERFGLTLSRVEVAKMEEASRAAADIKNVLRGVANTVTLKFAPGIKLLSDVLVDVTAKQKSFNEQLEKVDSANFAIAAAGILVSFDLIKTGILNTKKVYLEFMRLGQPSVEFMKDTEDFFTNVSNDIKDFKDTNIQRFRAVKEELGFIFQLFRTGSVSISRSEIVSPETVATVERAADGTEKLEQQINELNKELNDIPSAQSRLAQMLGDLKEFRDNVKGAGNDPKDSLPPIKEVIDFVANGFKMISAASSDYERNLRKLADQKLTVGLNRLKEFFDSFQAQDSFQEKVEKGLDRFSELGSTLNDLAFETSVLRGEFGQLQDGVPEFLRNMGMLADETTREAIAAATLSGSLDGLPQQIRDINQAFLERNATAYFETFKSGSKDIDDSLKRNGETAKVFKVAFTSASRGIIDDLKNTGSAIEALEKLALRAFDKIASAFFDIALFGSSGSGGIFGSLFGDIFGKAGSDAGPSGSFSVPSGSAFNLNRGFATDAQPVQNITQIFLDGAKGNQEVEDIVRKVYDEREGGTIERAVESTRVKQLQEPDFIPFTQGR